jgi:hypothetical protein
VWAADATVWFDDLRNKTCLSGAGLRGAEPPRTPRPGRSPAGSALGLSGKLLVPSTRSDGSRFRVSSSAER